MKRTVTVIASVTLLLAGCSSASVTASKTKETSQAAAETSSSELTQASVSPDSKALIVVYNSGENDDNPDAITGASVTTVNKEKVNPDQAIADMIQKKTGLKEYVIASDANYPSTDLPDIISYTEDQKDNYRPRLLNTIDDFDSYDTFLLVYPVWWYDLPKPMYTFFDTYDFSGRTIIPFNTNRGSGLSTTTDKIKALEPDATITDGYSIAADDVGDSTEKDVDSYLDSIGF